MCQFDPDAMVILLNSVCHDSFLLGFYSKFNQNIEFAMAGFLGLLICPSSKSMRIPMIVWLVDHVINEYKYVSRSELVLSLLWSGGYAPWCVHKGANPISSSCFVVSSTVSDSIKLSIFTSFSKLFIQGELLSPSLPHLKNKIKLLCSTRKLIHKMG